MKKHILSLLLVCGLTSAIFGTSVLITPKHVLSNDEIIKNEYFDIAVKEVRKIDSPSDPLDITSPDPSDTFLNFAYSKSSYPGVLNIALIGFFGPSSLNLNKMPGPRNPFNISLIELKSDVKKFKPIEILGCLCFSEGCVTTDAAELHTSNLEFAKWTNGFHAPRGGFLFKRLGENIYLQGIALNCNRSISILNVDQLKEVHVVVSSSKVLYNTGSSDISRFVSNQDHVLNSLGMVSITITNSSQQSFCDTCLYFTPEQFNTAPENVILALEKIEITADCKISRLSHCTRLKELIFNCKNFKNLPGLENYVLLEKLYLIGCYSLSANICEMIGKLLPHLQELDLSYTDIQSLSGLQNCTSLRKLDVSNCSELVIDESLIDQLQKSGVEIIR